MYAPNLVRIRGTYDDVNRLCAQVADRYGWGIVNVNLRAYYGEGSKTDGVRDRRAAWLAAAHGGGRADGRRIAGLRSWARRFREFLSAGLVDGDSPRLYGAQATGCAPIVRLVERGDGQLMPEIPDTIARSIAIGNPADGALRGRVDHGSPADGPASVSDADLVEGIKLLAETTGIFTETAGGVTLASAARAGPHRTLPRATMK